MSLSLDMCRYCRGSGELFWEDQEGFTTLDQCPYCMGGIERKPIDKPRGDRSGIQAAIDAINKSDRRVSVRSLTD
jgi:hypothetical protein